MASPYSKICNHTRLNRIDENFVRCLDCGQSMISQQKMLMNKTRKDFTKENKSFCRNFDRNFTNIIEETDEESSQPFFEYYTDKNWINLIIINRTVQFKSNPPKYQIKINGRQLYLTDQEINKILMDIDGIKVDEQQIKMRYGIK